MCIQKNAVRPHCRCAAAYRGRFAALAGLALGMPAFATDRIWSSDFGVWSDQSSWSPVGWPAVTDHVFIGSTPATIDAISNMDVGGTVAALDVVGRAHLNTEGRSLRVNGPARIDGFDSEGSPDFYARLRVTNGANAIDFRADSLQIAAESTLSMVSAPTVNVDTTVVISPDGRLIGNGIFNSGGMFANSGEIQVFGGDMVINVTNGASIDLDGGGNSEIIINDVGSDLSIVANAVTDPYDGYVFLGGDSVLSMTVGGSWATGPASHMVVAWVQSDGYESTIQGAPLSIGGDLILNGMNNTLRIQCPTTFTSTALFSSVGQLNDGASSLLQLNADSTIAGGQFELSPESRVQFTGSATLEDGEFVLDEGASVDFEGPTTIRGGTFTLFSNSLADGSVDFNGETEWDGAVTIDGVARQNGDATVTGATTILADVFDMDGGGGTIWNVNNNLTVNASALDTAVPTNWFDGVLNAGAGAFGKLTINLDHPAGHWTMLGEMNLTGVPVGGFFAERLAGTPVQISGDLDVHYKVRIAADTTFASVSTTTLADATDALQFSGLSQIQASATFNGSGLLENMPSGALTLSDGAGIDQVGLRNRGQLTISGPSGTAAVDRFENTEDGTWTVSMIGESPEIVHDLLIVSNGATTLSGHLRVSHADPSGAPCRPNIGDEFTVLTSLGAVSGTFAENPRSYSQGSRLDWTVLYGSNSVTLRLSRIRECAAGDVDDDGDVDLQDLAILLANFGTASGADWSAGDLDGDGDVELQDLAILLAHFGASCA